MGPAQTVSSCGLNLQTNHDIAIGDLAIECFGGQAIERLDVRVHVATNFVEMMKRKKIAGNESSKFDSTIPISLAILRRMVFALISHFRNIGILSSLFLSKTDKSICSWFVITSSARGSALTIFYNP